MGHTKEPWYYLRELSFRGIFGQSPHIVAMMQTMHSPCLNGDEDAARIVTCVNACAGMQDPAAEIAKLREEVEYWKLRAER